MLTTQNVVSTAEFRRRDRKEAMREIEQQRIITNQSNGNEIPLYLFSQHASFLSFQPPRFCAATCHLEDTTTQVFMRGGCVVVGSPSMEKVVWAAHHLRFYLRDKVGIDLELRGILLRNRVCSCRMNFAIDIQGFERHDSVGNVKQSDLFPGIIRKIRMSSGNEIACLVFETGNCIAMGLVRKEDENEVQEVNDLIFPLMLRNKTTSVDTSTGQQRAIHTFTKKIMTLFDPANTNTKPAAAAATGKSKQRRDRKRVRDDDDDDVTITAIGDEVEEDSNADLLEKIIRISKETFPGNQFPRRARKRQRKSIDSGSTSSNKQSIP